MSLLFFLKPVYRYLGTWVTKQDEGPSLGLKKNGKPKRKPANVVPDVREFASEILRETKKLQTPTELDQTTNKIKAVEQIKNELAALFRALKDEQRAKLEAAHEQKRRYDLLVRTLAKARVELERRRRKQEQEDRDVLFFLAEAGLI